jgi:ATP-dependent Clp protease protease subunit
MACEKEEPFIILRESINEIHFSGEINQKSISILIDRLLELETKVINKCKKLKRRYKEDNDSDEEDNPTISFRVEPKPIKLFITSNGGLVYQVFSAIDTIKSMKIPVHTYVKGFAASAATLLSLAGKKRFITENSYMLIHELRGASWGAFSQLKDSFENHTVLNDHIKNYYVKNTKLTMEELDEQLKHDIIIKPEKCLEKGLVDEILKN